MADPFDYLFGLEQVGVKFGLDNITALVEALGRPDRAFRSVHVAGTNGKGSVTAMVDAALRAAGHRSARYTSPHLVDLTERFSIAGAPVARGELAAVVADLRLGVEALLARGRLASQPTFFEVTTAAAFELFRRAGVTVGVFEVGLGGRLDATNVLEPAVAAITSIGFDHQQYLGSTLASIAAEKAGIAKPGVPLVVGDVDPVAAAAIDAVARERSARTVRAHEGVEVARLPISSPPGQVRGARVRLRTPARDYGEVEVALPGSHQVHNAIVAVRILELLDASDLRVGASAVRSGLREVRWPGRLDLRRLPDGREALLDAAHNEDGARALATFLAALRAPDAASSTPRDSAASAMKPPLVFAAMRDKDAAAMLAALAPEVGAIVLTRASHPRSTDPAALADLARVAAPGQLMLVEAHLPEALEAAWRLGARIVVAGSIFLLGDVMKVIRS